MRYLLYQGRLDLVWCTPALYMRDRGKVPYELLCAISRSGRKNHGGVIVVRKEGPIRSVKDLKGAVFSYVDRESATGFLLPNQYLETQGIDPLASRTTEGVEFPP